MRICLYLELEGKLIGCGISTAVKNQRKALELVGVEHTRNIRGKFDILHLNAIGPKSLYLIKKMKRKGVKVIIHSHVTADDFRNSYVLSNEIAPILKKYLVYYYNQADLLLCPSTYTKQVLRSYGVRVPIEVISNGIDLEKFKFDPEKREQFREKYDADGFVPLCVGHLFLRKGLDTFIEVAKNFPEFDFIWVGRRYPLLEDPRVTKLLKKAPKNVKFVNFIPDIIEAYSGSDIFLFPSYCENQGIVLMEAASCKLPIICRNLKAYEDWLKNEHNCLMASTEREFIERFEKLLNNSSLRKKLAKQAYEDVKQHSLERIGNQLKEIYEKLLDGEYS